MRDKVKEQVLYIVAWNESACLRQQASFWRQLWLDCGCPSVGVTATIRRLNSGTRLNQGEDYKLTKLCTM